MSTQPKIHALGTCAIGSLPNRPKPPNYLVPCLVRHAGNTSGENPVIYVPIRRLYTCREASTNRTFYAKQTVRQAKLVQFSRFNPARSKVSLPAGMNMYA